MPRLKHVKNNIDRGMCRTGARGSGNKCRVVSSGLAAREEHGALVPNVHPRIVGRTHQ